MKFCLPIAAGLLLTAAAAAQNLLVNGDFENGNVGFSSQYLFGGVGGGPETYDVLDDPRSGNSLFASIGDHTTGEGLMLVVNGSTRNDGPFAWSQTVSVEPESTYLFSLWATNIFGSNPSRFLVRINGVQVGNIIEVDPELGAWNEHAVSWESGTNDLARIEIVFASLTFGGNDTAFDDFSFRAEVAPCLVGLPNPENFEEIDLQVVVPGNANPFLAGQPDGTRTKSDSAPDQSPVFATEVTEGDILAFAVEGSVSFAGSGNPTSPPDGRGNAGSASALGLAGYTSSNALPIDALVGVFLNDGIPSDPAPEELTYPDEFSFEVLAPQLHQVFYIGDGLTGNGGGQRQEFVVPTGATRLILGTSDGFGWFNNTGQFEVSICRLRNLDFVPELSPTTIRFNQSAYTADFGNPVDGSIEMAPLPRGGLYSQGLLVTVRDQEGLVAGIISPTITTALDFDGLLLGASSRRTAETGLGGVKGTARFGTSLTTLSDPTLATFQLSDLPPGLYDLALMPWNQLGPTEDIFVTGFSQTLDPYLSFEPATLEITGAAVPDLTLTGDLALNPQTGLLEQKLTFTNTTGRPLEGFRLFVTDLPEGVTLWNAHGTIDGVPYLDYFGTLAPGESIVLVLEYYRANRNPDFTPAFEVQPPEGTLPPAGTQAPAALDLRVLRLDQDGLLLEFLTEASTRYRVEYSSNMQDWSVAQPPINGTGQRIQWIDAGPPKTMSFPTGVRYYRVVELEN